jgi:hypothetical protein
LAILAQTATYLTELGFDDFFQEFTHIVRIPQATLNAGGSLQPDFFIQNLDLGGGFPVSIKAGCDGKLYILAYDVYGNPLPLKVFSLADGSEQTPSNTALPGNPIDMVLTCNAGEVLGSSSDSSPGSLLWKLDNKGVTVLGRTASGMLSLTPSGQVLLFVVPYPGRPAVYHINLPDGQAIQPKTTGGTVQAYPCGQAPADITLTDKSIRWLPQKDDITNAAVQFTVGDGSQLSSATLTIQGVSETTDLAGKSSPYSVIWKATARCPRDSQGVETCLPAGDYSFSLTATTADQKVKGPLQGTISLVEVTSVDIQPKPGGAPLDPNPPVPRHPDEPEDNRINRPGGGLRIFAEAAPPSDGSLMNGPLNDQAQVVVTIFPTVPVPVRVALRLVDVADPDGGVGNDNYGTGFLDSAIMIPANTDMRAVILSVSHNPGDNYRVGASTWQSWVDHLTPIKSTTGEVTAPDGNTLLAGGGLSKMITVWRTVNLEIDSMDPPPTDVLAPERNFVVGNVSRIEGTQDETVRIFLTPSSPGPSGMDRLRDQSPDRSGVRGQPGYGDGRFQHGQLTVGSGPGAEELFIPANGIDYVEDLGGLMLDYVIEDVLQGDIISVGRVVSGEPANGLFVLTQLSGIWPSTNDPMTLVIGGVAFPVLPGGVLDSTMTTGNHITGTVRVKSGSLPFRLVDDDEEPKPFPVSTKLLNPSDNPTENAYAAAYIWPKIYDVPNLKHAPFKRNVESWKTDDDKILSPEADKLIAQGRDSAPSSDTCWVAYLQGAFQPSERSDSDPDNEGGDGGPVGYTNGTSGSQIYVEQLREVVPSHQAACIADTPAHELGHQFGLDDNPDDNAQSIMRKACDSLPYFDASDLKAIRLQGVMP